MRIYTQQSKEPRTNADGRQLFQEKRVRDQRYPICHTYRQVYPIYDVMCQSQQSAEIRDQRLEVSEVRGQRSEVRGQRSEVDQFIFKFAF